MRKPFLLFIVFAITQSYIAQHKYDIGISFSDQSIGYPTYENNISFEFRRKHNDKWMFTNNVFFGNNNRPFYSYSNIYEVNGSNVTMRSRNESYKNEINGSFGFERLIINSIKKKPIDKPLFSYSLDLILGLSQAFKENFNVTYFYDSNSTNLPSQYINSNYDFYEANFIHAGLQLQLKANIPLNERLILFLSYRGNLGLYLTLNESYGYRIDRPNNIPLNDIMPFPNTFVANRNMVVGLRCKLGKKSSVKNSEPKKN